MMTADLAIAPHAHAGDYVILVLRDGVDLTSTEEGKAALGRLHPSRWATISLRSAEEKAEELGWGAKADGTGLTFHAAELLYSTRTVL